MRISKYYYETIDTVLLNQGRKRLLFTGFHCVEKVVSGVFQDSKTILIANDTIFDKL